MRLAWCLASIVVAWSGRARAESPPVPCGLGPPSPSTASVPTNQPAFVVVDHHAWGTGGVVMRLEREEGSSRVPVDGEVLTSRSTSTVRATFVPAAPLREGFVHVLVWDVCTFPYGTGLHEQRYSVGPAIPLPAPNGILSARVEGVTWGDELVGYQLTATLDTAADLEIWRDSLDFVAAVGAATAPASTIEASTARFRLPVHCRGFPGEVPEGEHVVTARIATFVGETLLEESAAVTVTCEGAILVDSTGRELTGPEITRIRSLSAPMDGGPGRDAGVHVDAGSSGRSASCAADGRPARGALVTMLLVVLAARLRRRARQR